MNMEKLFYFLGAHKTMLLFAITGAALVSLFWAFFIFNKRQNIPDQSLPFPTAYPSAQKPSPSQVPFQAVETSPQNNEKNVYPGEIEVSIFTNVYINSNKSFILEFSPPLPYYFKITNTFPAKQVIAKIYGGLQTNTTYTAVLKDSFGKTVYSWNFTTSITPAQSSSSLQVDKEKAYLEKYYPLVDYTPYKTGSFDIVYKTKSTLEVKMKISDREKVKQEVIDWIKSHGVDPATHSINYINSF